MKKLTIAVIAVICSLSLVLMACAKNKNSTGGPQFAEGARTVYTLGEEITFDEFIDDFVPSDDNYSLVITGKNGFELDVTGRMVWIPDKVGKYVLCWTVKSGANKGSVTIEITVEPPELSWEYSVDNTVYKLGDTLVFEEFFNKMNISASPRPWSMHMDSVTVDDVKTTFAATDTQYTFNSFSPHVFEYHIETVYGQTASKKQTVYIKKVDQATLDFLEENDITEYNSVAVYQGGVTLGNSSYTAGQTGAPRSSATPIDMSYIAYNGDYTVGDYLAVDYTGNNMPVIGFFVNKITESIFNDGKGIVLLNGLTNNDGEPFSTWETSVNSRLNIYGPRKVDQPDSEAVSSMRASLRGTDMPLSMTVQAKDENKNTKYRLIIGVSSASESKITVSVYLYNIETEEKIYNGVVDLNAADYVKEMNGSTAVKDATYKFASDYFSGNIVLWGQFGKNTAMDKIYPIKHADSIEKAVEALFPNLAVSGVVRTHVSDVAVGQELDIKDYFIKENGHTHSLYYTDEEGNKTNVTGDTFSFSQAGKYTLVFSDGIRKPVSLPIGAVELDSGVKSWLETSKATFYNAQISANKSVTFAPATYAAAGNYPTSSAKSDAAYISFNGNFGVNSYIEVDYTGNNMPAIMFFGGYTTPSYYYDGTMKADENKGLVFVNGVTVPTTGEVFPNWSTAGSVNNRLNIVGPNKIGGNLGNINTAGGWIVSNIGRNTNPELGMKYHAENPNTPFKFIIGISAATDTNFTVSAYLLNRVTGEVLYKNSATITASFGTEYFSGNIALYGQYGKTTVLDKIYEIQQATSGIDEIIPRYTDSCEFKSDTITSVGAGKTVNVSELIDDTSSFILALKSKDGSVRVITDSTFVVDVPGTYTLYYWDKNDAHSPASMLFTVSRGEIEDGNGSRFEFDMDNWLQN